jgi:multicomponent K+:H+ antiporter subunit A
MPAPVAEMGASPLALALIIGTPFLISALALMVAQRSLAWAGRLALIAPATVVALGIPAWLSVAGGGVIVFPIEWFPSLGFSANLRLDRLGTFFVLLIGIIGLGIVQYSRYYLGEKATGGFWALLLSFMGAMLGIVLSDSLLLLFVFWELTTITSALLIGLDFHDAKARHGAIQAFLVTGLGGLALLAGIVLVGQIGGSYDLSTLAEPATREAILASPWSTAALLLLLLGAFTKSAQFPFHFWLPGAMAAPAPISAYLHSATMVKAGVFLIGRLFPIFHEAAIWLPLLATVGLVTFFVAGWNAVRAYDLKQLLAHSTVAYLGVLTALYGFYARVGLQGEVVNILNHALYKSSLFLLIGWLEKAAGTRDLAMLQRERWWSTEKWAGSLFAIGALAMAGLPFVLGFLAKDTFYQAVAGGPIEDIVAGGWGNVLALAITVAASTLATIYALKLFAGTFLGPDAPPTDRGYPRHKISPWLLIIPTILLVPQVIGGVVPGWYLGMVVEPGTTWGQAFWYYLDVKVMLSIGIIVAGVGGYLIWERLAALPEVPGSQRISDGLAEGALGYATWQSRFVQAGGHPRYIAITMLTAVAAIVLGLLWADFTPADLTVVWGPDVGLAWLPAMAIIAGALLTVLVRPRIGKLVMLALVGFGMAVYYVIFRAPDLALTQLLVETISLILLLLVFRMLPKLGADTRTTGTRVAHAGVAALAGVFMGGYAWVAGSHPAMNRAGAEQLALSLPVAEGRNVVNVILVDFRGIDTFGEAVVLLIAALGAIALFRAGRGKPRERDPLPPPEDRRSTTPAETVEADAEAGRMA